MKGHAYKRIMHMKETYSWRDIPIEEHAHGGYAHEETCT